MAKRKRPPSESRLTREPTTAFARRQRTDGGDAGDDGAVEPPKETAAGSGPTKSPAAAAAPGTVGPVTTDAPTAPGTAPATAATGTAPAVPTPAAGATAKPAAPAAAPTAPADEPTSPSTTPPTPEAAAPAPPAAAAPSAPAEQAPAVAPLPLMPHPNQIPPGEPEDAAEPPGKVPPGDSRSLRRGAEFVLVYRLANVVVSRFGPVGRRGQFRVVEYPTTAYASNAYARECSRWVSEGFADYREP